MIRLLMIGLLLAASLIAEGADRRATRKGASPRPRGAAKHQVPTTNKPTTPKKPAPPNPYRRVPYVGALSLDAETGKVLFSDGADRPARMASCTKLMTALLVLEDIKAKRYALTDRVTATPDVYKASPSWVGIKVGESMTVDDLLMALMVQSANDAAIALGVHSAGSLEAFVVRMNARAAALGMTNTHYYNPNGLPPGRRSGVRDFNVSTCSDYAKLAMLLVRMPEIFKYTSVKVGTVTDGKGKPLKFVNHNNVMVKDKLKIINSDGTEAVDGLKTGYIDAGGSSVVLTGTRNGKRAITIVFGSDGTAVRDEHAGRLLREALTTLAGW